MLWCLFLRLRLRRPLLHRAEVLGPNGWWLYVRGRTARVMAAFDGEGLFEFRASICAGGIWVTPLRHVTMSPAFFKVRVTAGCG